MKYLKSKKPGVQEPEAFYDRATNGNLKSKPNPIILNLDKLNDGIQPQYVPKVRFLDSDTNPNIVEAYFRKNKQLSRILTNPTSEE